MCPFEKYPVFNDTKESSVTRINDSHKRLKGTSSPIGWDTAKCRGTEKNSTSIDRQFIRSQSCFIVLDGLKIGKKLKNY